ncbi:hypothetical protein C0Z18_19860 [Trinickia dabaoshanensis]|uniref:Uncharacterized protein n=1 Tax=Trinickia dabaoshanensis TaxID=564714 RepID=A0A2N7VKP4_9BURK|nr:hypothetical protein C0Z18_19860 [Trinickia dabaoshanensis]
MWMHVARAIASRCQAALDDPRAGAGVPTGESAGMSARESGKHDACRRTPSGVRVRRTEGVDGVKYARVERDRA